MILSEPEVLAELDLGEPPQELADWAKEHLDEDPETRCQVLQELRDMIYGKYFKLRINRMYLMIILQKKVNAYHIGLTTLFYWDF